MNLDVIENLSEDEIMELYNYEIIEKIAAYRCYYVVICTDGNANKYCEHPSGWYGCRRELLLTDYMNMLCSGNNAGSFISEDYHYCW